MSDKQLPILPIKITRLGNSIKFKYGKYQLTLKELDEGSQYYSGLLLDKFMTEVTTKLLSEIVEKEQRKEDAKTALGLMGADEALSTDSVVRTIHEDLFGGK